MRFLSTLIIILFFLSAHVATAQHHNTATVSGTITSDDGEPMIGVLVFLNNTSKGAQSDIDGSYNIAEIEPGSYRIIFSSIGYKKDSIDVHLAAKQHLQLNRTMQVDTFTDHVTITAKTDNENIKEQSYEVNVIDASKYANTSSDINQVLNKTTGVRVREEGGLGSSFNFMLNGFSGNQIRFFIDGIPMTNFGSALSLNNIPINLAERIEVYKGVVPVWLGADALGGAVNIVTNQKLRNYADASYSYGSFNTHRAALNIRYTDSSGFTVSANTFLNYSDNNFAITAKISDPKTGVFGPETKYKHFHDRYKSAGGVFEIGVTDKKYADRLLLGVIISGNNKQLQQGATMQSVVGEAYQTNFSVIPTLKYKKENFLVKNLALTFFASYNFSDNKSIDTSSRRYNWDGSYSYPIFGTSKKAELGDFKTIYLYNDRNALTTTNLSYDITKHHNFTFNHTFNRLVRKEEDAYDPNRLPDVSPKIVKHSFGLGYKLTAFENRFSATLFTKLFMMNSDLSDENKVTTSSSIHKSGFGTAISYFILRNTLQAKASYENTYRMPDAGEILGDGLSVMSNPLLQPEHSSNINLGLRLQKKINNKNQFGAEVGFIYRNAEDYIRASTLGPKTLYVNERNVRVTGIEAGMNYGIKNTLFFEVNATYQNIINTDKYDPEGFVNFLYKLRLPNMPFFFANANIDLRLKKIGFDHGALNINLNSNYVEAFYLYWPTLGDPEYKRSIPTQFTHNATVTYSLHNNRYNISLECRNITDVKLYDYFYVQKPGRSFSVKFRYFFKK